MRRMHAFEKHRLSGGESQFLNFAEKEKNEKVEVNGSIS
jgi:hypothetical protein